MFHEAMRKIVCFIYTCIPAGMFWGYINFDDPVVLILLVVTIGCIATTLYFIATYYTIKQKNHSLIKIIDELNHGKKKPLSKYQEEYQRLLEAVMDEQLYAHQQLDRDSFATRMHISRHRLNEILSTNTDGLSFPQWINNIRLEKACDLLQRDSDMSVKEVAAAVGLTPNNLRRLFRQRYNITPTEYRQNFAY